MREIQVQSLGQEDLEKEMATHSSILAWRIPWKEKPGGLQSMGLKKESDMTEQLNHNRRMYHSFIHSFLHTCFLRASPSQDTGQGLTIDLAPRGWSGPLGTGALLDPPEFGLLAAPSTQQGRGRAFCSLAWRRQRIHPEDSHPRVKAGEL